MKGLSLETIPPIHLPFRFFNTAPWMGVLAALLLLSGAEQTFSTQWSPELLGVTHLLTLGFMTMVMLGAMFQLVPVISGRMIPGGRTVATLVHLLLLTGVLLLVAGFYWQAYWLLAWALPVLLAAFITFLGALGSLLLRRIGGGDSIYCIRFAALSLLITVALGALRSANYAGLPVPLALANIANIHLAWGLVGWALLLVMGVSYQVIPMFHVTPSYPTALARSLPAVVFLSLLLLTFINNTVVQALVVVALCTVAVVYASYTIGLLNQRKRKIPDITASFWRLALICLMASALLLVGFYFASHVFLSPDLQQRAPVVIGILMIYGFAGSVIMGMLQKIVPFLSYLHLQRRCMTNFELLKTLPHMGEIISEPRSRWQFRLHLSALLALLTAAITGFFVGAAALMMAADFAWLGFTLASATRLYRNTAVRIATVLFCSILVLITGCDSQSTHQPVAITVGVEPSGHGDSLRIATINLWGVSFSGIDISYKINDRFKVFTEYLGTNTVDIDIVLIQEAWKNSARKIILEDTAVARQFPFRVDANEEPGGSGLIILSAFPIESTSFHRFQATGNCFKFWEGDCLSGKGILAVKLRVGQYSFWLANTHTIACYPERGETVRSCDNGDANGKYRQSQILEIRNYFDCLVGTEPGLIGGDFNFTRTSIYYPLMENPIHTDCRAGASTGWTATEEVSADPDRLDYIWTRPGDTLKWHALNPIQQIFDDPIKLPNGEYRPLSDHPMLMADFCLVHTNDHTNSCVPFEK